jgi:hypothetical protein
LRAKPAEPDSGSIKKTSHEFHELDELADPALAKFVEFVAFSIFRKVAHAPCSAQARTSNEERLIHQAF